MLNAAKAAATPDKQAAAVKGLTTAGKAGAAAASGPTALAAAPMPKPGAVVGGPKGKTASGEAADSADPVAASIQTWKAGVRSATQKIPHPDVKASTQVAKVQAAATGAVNKNNAAAKGIPQEGKSAIPTPPKTEKTAPDAPAQKDYVPEATVTVASVSYQPLGMQVLLPLEESPQHHMPQLGGAPAAPAPASTGTPDQAKTAADRGKPEPETKEEDPAKKHADKVSVAAAKEPATLNRVGPRGELILEDKGGVPPPAPEMPPVFKSSIQGVLAQLLADPKSEAEQMLKQARASAYGGQLQIQFPEMGYTLVDGLAGELKQQFLNIGKEAGISEEELKQAVAKRQEELKTKAADATNVTSQAGDKAKKDVRKSGDSVLDAISGTRDALDEDTENKLATAKGDDDPEVIKSRRERLIRDVERKIAKQILFYDDAGKNRDSEIRQLAIAQKLGYRAAAQLDEETLVKAAGDDAKKIQAAKLTAAASWNWNDAKVRALDQLMVDKKKETAKLVTARQDAAREGRVRATEQVRAWSDARLKEHRSWLLDLIQRYMDWSRAAKAESEAFQTRKDKATSVAIASDMNFLSGVAMTAGEELSEEAKKKLDSLSAEQKAIVTTYYGLDQNGNPIGGAKDAKNPLAAVAAGLRVRLAQEHSGKIREQFESELDKTPDAEWTKLDALGKAENPGFIAASVAKEINQALHGGLIGWNDEPRVFKALGGLTKVQGMALRRLYRLSPDSGGYGKDLDSDIHSELGGAERTRAEALLAGDKTLADVATLREAMHGGITGWGTDEKAIMDTLRNKTPEEREKIKALYMEKYQKNLDEDIKEELTGTFEDEHDLKRADALMEGDTAKADAIAIDQAMFGGLTGAGTDRKAIEGVYEQIRQETEKKLQDEARRTGKTLTTKELEAEVAGRYRQVESSYNTTYKDNWNKSDESALRQAYKDDLSDGELALVIALADNDLTKADAARIQIEKESLVYADDEVINGVLKHQYERALEETKRDEGPALYAALEKQRLEAQPPWDAFRLKKEQHELEKQLEARAQKASKVYMNQLETTYDTTFGSTGKGSLRVVIEKNMDGEEKKEARKRVARGGWLTPAEEIHFATEGLGTKDGALTKALDGKTKEEIDEIRKEWAKSHPNESLEQLIASETSGRLEFELKQKLKGEPMSMKEELDNMEAMAKHEQANPSHFALDEGARLEFRLKQMQERYVAANDPTLSEVDRNKKIEEFQRFAGYTNVAVEEHKEKIEAVTNSLVTAVTTTIAVAVAAIAIIFSGGTATPGVLAAFAAWAGTAGGAATIALGTALVGIGIKKAMLGSDYGVEEWGTDLAVGGVEALVAAATAGMSKALMAKGGFSTMAQSGKMANRMLAHGISGAMFGAAGAVPSSMARLMLDGKTWEGGGAWEKLLEGTKEGAISGAVAGGVMGAAGGIKAHPPVGVHGGEPVVEPIAHEVPPARATTATELVPPEGLHSSETLKSGLPPEMQKKIPVYVDPELHGDTVRAQYTVDENGVVKDIHLRAGPNATPRDIELHVNTVRTMQKYAGLQGRVRALIRRTAAWVTKNGPLKPGTRAWEAQLEVEKLPSVIQDRMQQLENPELEPIRRAELEADVENFRGQFNEHESVLSSVSATEEGRGFVAAEGQEHQAPKGTTEEEPPGVTPKQEAKKGGPSAAADEHVPKPATENVPAVEPAPQPEGVTTPKESVPTADELRAARKEEVVLRSSKDNATEQIKLTSDLVESAQEELLKLKAMREKNLQKPNRRPSDNENLQNHNKLIREKEVRLENLKNTLGEFEAKLARSESRLAEIKAIEEKYQSSQPWRNMSLNDTDTAKLGLHGELEATTALQEAGFEPIGKTVKPDKIVLPEDFDAAVEANRGQTGIDGLYKRTNGAGETEYWVVESKTTGDPKAGDPTGKGALSSTDNGDQLSDLWIKGNLRKTGLPKSEQAQIETAVNQGKVKKVYAQTDPVNGTRFFEVVNVPGDPTQVKLGEEIFP